MVRKDLREEIEEKLIKVRSSSEIYDRRIVLLKDSLINVGDLYSFWIENPDLRRKLLFENLNSKTVKRKARRGIRNIHNAWYFLSQFGRNCDFANILDPKILCGVNALVNGKKASTGAFRTQDVSLDMVKYTPPSFEKIPKKIEEVINMLREHYFIYPLDSSIHAHLSLVLIQPFRSGNKRTAHLIQNRLLMDWGYPPAVIPAGEAKFYFDLLEKAVPVYEKGEIFSDNPFSNYIASKVNNGLDVLLGDLNVLDGDSLII